MENCPALASECFLWCHETTEKLVLPQITTISCRAALGAAEGVSEVIKVVEGDGGLDDLAMEDDKEEFLYTAFYKGRSFM